MNNRLTFSIWSFFRRDVILPPKSNQPRLNSILFITWATILFTILSGAIRKWVVGPGGLSNLFFLMQLVLPFIFYYFVSRSDIKPKFHTPFLYFVFIGYLSLTALNPMNKTMYHGLLGLLIHLAIWVSWLAYYKKRHEFPLERLTGFLILILLAEVLLGAVQYSLPGDHFLNIRSTGDESEALVGDAFRVSGTFSYLGGFQAMITLYAFFIWFLLVLRFPTYIALAVFLLSLFAAFMSGSRSAVGFLVVVSVVGFLLTSSLVTGILRVAWQGGLLVVCLYFFGGSLIVTYMRAYENFEERVDTNRKELEWRLNWMYDEVLNFKGKYPVYGVGLGSTYQGANAIFGESVYAQEYGYYETEPGRVILEGGFILFFLRIILFIVFLRHSYIPMIGKILLLLIFLNNMVIFNIYQGLFFVLGIMFVDRAYYLRKQGSYLNPA